MNIPISSGRTCTCDVASFPCNHLILSRFSCFVGHFLPRDSSRPTFPPAIASSLAVRTDLTSAKPVGNVLRLGRPGGRGRVEARFPIFSKIPLSFERVNKIG